jgi:selenocysteine lyase/cysteine desulfurase
MLTTAHAAAGTHRAESPAEFFTALRAREFSRLDRSGEAYLDYTGSGLYGASQLEAHMTLLGASVLGNPHSESPASLRSTAAIDEARLLTLGLLRADPDEYDVIFTANASAAVKLVAESFPFGAASALVLAADAHNSVNGIREYAAAAGVEARYIPLDAELRLRGAEDVLAAARGRGPSLFAFPAQSNFSGVQHPLWLTETARALGYAVLLDAAAFLPTNRLDLREVRADFVALSFYKIFGYPTGLGALVARRDALARLRRPWFAGGTIEFASVQNRTHLFRTGAAAFEDGTPSFLAISALRAGFELFADVGVDRLHDRVAGLTMQLLDALGALQHDNGRALTWMHGPRDGCARGGTVAFNVLDRDGRVIPYQEVEARARTARVSIRGGCFCNPGAAEHAFGVRAAETARCMERARRAGFSIPSFARCLGDAPVGAGRAAQGLATNDAEIERRNEVVRGVGTKSSSRDPSPGAPGWHHDRDNRRRSRRTAGETRRNTEERGAYLGTALPQ